MEIWKPIPSLSDFEVSSYGRIKRFRNRRNCSPDGIIKQRLINSGYYVVSLCYQNKAWHRLVHRLVAEAFICVCPKGMEVNHKDGNNQNNHADNLEYVSPSTNRWHSALVHGIPRGEEHWNSRITEEQARQIIFSHKQGLGYKRLAKKFNLSWCLVRAVASGKTWGHLQ